LPDTTTQLRAILGRTLRELEQAIDNPAVTSALRGLGRLFGLEDKEATARTKPAASRRAAATEPRPVSAAQVARSEEEKTARASRRARTQAKPKAGSTSGATRARTGTRREQLLALIIDQPGITVAQAAKQFGLKDATGLYAVARRLQADGRVRKRGSELHPTAKAQQN
jgi:hypothetical protein